jgi:hypothetical protein
MTNQSKILEALLNLALALEDAGLKQPQAIVLAPGDANKLTYLFKDETIYWSAEATGKTTICGIEIK